MLDRRVHRAGAGRRAEVIAWLAGSRGAPAPSGMIGHLLGRLQRAAGGGAPAAGAEGDHHLLASPTTATRTTSTTGGAALLPTCCTGPPRCRPSSRSRPIRVVGERWREMWRSGSRRRRPAETWCRTSGATTTGSRAPSARTTGDRVPGLRRRRLAGRLHRRGTAPARNTCDVPAPGADRALGACLSDDGAPGPPVGFLQEALRWWDHWLKGTRPAIEEEPTLSACMQDSVVPHPSYEERPGRW